MRTFTIVYLPDGTIQKVKTLNDYMKCINEAKDYCKENLKTSMENSFMEGINRNQSLTELTG